jgi:asparagine synthase (glutamine-hydrolysing)
MPENNSTLVAGSPRFADKRLASLAKEQGALSAWREALQSGSFDAIRILSNISGDFAVGLTEPGGRTVLAVDRFAIQPMCYRVKGGQIHFASRADELADENPEIDPQAIFDYLYFHVIPSPRTIYKDIFRLAPGNFAVFENGELTVAPYWVPSFKEQSNVSFGALKDEFLDLLQTAVTTQLGAGKPACFLSGGTDSSTIAGMLARASQQQASSYSIGFDAQGYDEMEYARLAARHFKIDHHEYYVTPDDLVRSIPAVAAHFDQPFGNSSALPAYYCARMAHDDGVSKLMAGDGGDELFGGNTRYAKQRVFNWYQRVPQGLREALLEPISGVQLVNRIPLLRKAASYVNQAKVEMPDRLMTYNLLFRLGTEEMLSPALLAQVDQLDPARQQREVWAQVDGKASLVNKMLAFDWRYTLAECDLHKVMGTSQMAGVDVGFPMLDDRLLAFSERLPTAYKLKGFKLRWFFKEALRGFLPDEILSKKKQGFGLPFGVWANQTPALKALAKNSLESLAARGVVRADFVQTLLNDRLPEHPGYYGEMVWILTMLEQWLAAKAPNFKVLG